MTVQIAIKPPAYVFVLREAICDESRSLMANFAQGNSLGFVKSPSLTASLEASAAFLDGQDFPVIPSRASFFSMAAVKKIAKGKPLPIFEEDSDEEV